jgi:DNA replication and repair protein RecF
VHLVSLAIFDFRNIVETEIRPDATGTTVITGVNGAGKTSVLEAIDYLASLQSFRGSPKEAMVRRGAPRSIIRAETLVDGRAVSIDAEVTSEGRSRTLVNRQTVRRRSELHQALRTTVFSPGEIGVVRAGPAERRRFLDETLAVIDPKAARAAEDLDRVLRQRGALLRNSRRTLSPEVATTLDVWDARLDQAGTALVEARETLTVELAPITSIHYSRLAGREIDVGLAYRRSWSGRLDEALADSRRNDLERGATLVGPHRDELELSLGGLPSRTHASQGEQRSLALALQLAAHQLATERLGSAPLLLLDDVFSELDPNRSRALLAGLPPGQALLTTALPAPPEVSAAKVYILAPGGRVAPPGDTTIATQDERSHGT